MFSESFQYHPFGLLILALFIVTAGVSLIPALRKAVIERIERHAGWFKMIHLGFLIAFVGFGVTRVLAYVITGGFHGFSVMSG
jgi:hypothetical protein